MPTIKHLLEELKLLNIKPDDVRISAKAYDAIIDDVEEQKEQREEELEENPEDYDYKPPV
jgi:hypothetical protein